MNVRASGVLLHVSSLPSDFGIGDLGPWAYRFVDFLSELKQSYWQILPLGPTSPAIGNSPYSCFSAFAGNPILISPEGLQEKGLVGRDDIQGAPQFDQRRVHYDAVTLYKGHLLRQAFERCKAGLGGHPSFQRFCERNRYWLDDYALFMTLKNMHDGVVWTSWPAEYRDRDPGALQAWRQEQGEAMQYERFVQFLFFQQWRELRDYCALRTVQIIGDLPIYVTFDSADVWANPRLFKLDAEKQPRYVAGVPPDYFSATGQRWGNPVYDWETIKSERFLWWIRRMESNLRLFDSIRLDHFRGFAAYWEVPAAEQTAVNGVWIEAPGEELFTALSRRFPNLPVIAEDLGYITPDVRELKQRFGFPGMKILQFGFGENIATNTDAPHTYDRNCVVYTGTHDNNTMTGWFFNEAASDDRRRFLEYIGCDGDDRDIHLKGIRLAMASVANTAVFPMQDLLGLSAEHRMNTPSVSNGNWEWRLLREEMDPSRLGRIAEMTRFFGRA